MAETETVFPVTVDTKTLCKMLGVGERLAIRLGENAGASIRWNGRRLWSVKKIMNYVDSQTEG